MTASNIAFVVVILLGILGVAMIVCQAKLHRSASRLFDAQQVTRELEIELLVANRMIRNLSSQLDEVTNQAVVPMMNYRDSTGLLGRGDSPKEPEGVGFWN